VSSIALVQRLVAEQYPAFAALPLREVPSAGTDNALFRLGDEYCVRLPKTESAARLVNKETRWLPILRPQLPLRIPDCVATGRPDLDYPWQWSIWRWIEGEDALQSPPHDLQQAAIDLGGFVVQLQFLDCTNGPAAGTENFYRGIPLMQRDTLTRKAIAGVSDEFDAGKLLACWEHALAATTWEKPGVWVHGDLHAGNLLTRQGRIHAVLDFGGLGVGDPAVDLMPAWTLFAGPSREQFKATVGADDATWQRSRGWTLSVAVIALDYYRGRNQALATSSRLALQALLA
jgi:aminoglycoside phosphotransferase (APT) family kinase protein